MDGRLNILFGFSYLLFTIALGPLLLVPQARDNMKAIGVLDAGLSSMAQGDAISGVVAYLKGLSGSHFVASAVHGHGNLEALLNLLVGLVLLKLAVPPICRAAATLIFILGTLLHSGMLYLYAIFGAGWALGFTKFGAFMLVGGVGLMAVLSALGLWRKEAAP